MLIKKIYNILKDIRDDLHEVASLLEDILITLERVECNQDESKRDFEIFSEDVLAVLNNLSMEIEKIN